MRIIVAIVYAGFIVAASPVSCKTHSLKYHVDRIVKPFVEKKWCPGMIAGVIDGDKKYIFRYGKKSANEPVPPDEDTVFEIGSVTKLFTALTLITLSEENKLSLYDPITKYIPEIGDAEDTVSRIKLLDLATHSSGLPRIPGNMTFTGLENPYADYGKKDLYDFLKNFKQKIKPGERVEYSNLGAGLLGHVISIAAGEGYENLVVKQICNPLGMKNTRITLTSGMKKNLAEGHDADGESFPVWDFAVLKGCGAFRSTLGDLMIFLSAQLGLKKTSINSSIEKSHDVIHRIDEDLDMAIGWHVTRKKNIYWHNGSTGGYSSFIGFNKKKKYGVVILTNTGIISAVPVVNIAGGDILKILDGDTCDIPELREETKINPELLDDYTGRYKIGTDVEIKIKKKANKLYVAEGGEREQYRVYPESPDKFFYKIADVQLEFKRDSKGKVTELIIHSGTNKTTAKKSD